jgi:ABC-type lipoprotein export system ATPase subunit
VRETMIAVRFENVTRRYRRGEEEVVAIRDLSFELEAGGAVALLGPSGCGKSTTLHLVAGVDRPDGGRLTVCGVRVETAPEGALTDLRRRKVGMVFQAFHLMPHLTVEENVALPLALDGKRDARRVSELLERVGLAHRRGHYPSELSGGEQQRTAVARAVVHRPAVLLADEPTGNLDSRSGDAVLELIFELRREEGTAVLVATHDEHVAAMAERTIHLHDGRAA